MSDSPHKSNKTMDNSGRPSSGRQSGSLRGLEDPAPIPPQCAASVVKNAFKSHCTRGGKSISLPPSGAAPINSKWAVLAAAAQWKRRQSSGSKAAAAWQQRAAQWWRWQREDNGGSAAAAWRCFAGARWQLSGSNKQGKRAARHWRQLLQQSGGSGSRTMAASAQGRWWQHRDGGRAAGQRCQCSGSRAV
jgi:hypothetical protein